MICDQCRKEGKKSTLICGPSTTTLIYCSPFYDEEGKLHHHDSNVTMSSYTCSNGHTFSLNSSGSCWCGWPNKDGAKIEKLEKQKEKNKT